MKDSGKPCRDLNPAVVYHDKGSWFGSLRGLYESWGYSRSDILHMGAHGSQQKSVKGNKTDSYNAIVVAGKGKVKSKDTLYELTYSACTSEKGADGMTVSHEVKEESCHHVNVFLFFIHASSSFSLSLSCPHRRHCHHHLPVCFAF